MLVGWRSPVRMNQVSWVSLVSRSDNRLKLLLLGWGRTELSATQGQGV